MKFNLSGYDCLGEAIRESGIPLKSRTALVEVDRDKETGRWSHLEVHREATRFGALLQSLGVMPGDRCAILMSNQSKWVLSALGIFWAGAVLVPLDYKLTPSEQLALLAHCKPRALVVESHLWEKLRAESPGLAKQLKILVTEAPVDAALNGALRWEENPSNNLRYHGRRREDVATIVYSSGTGGQAKGCLLTHENYLRQIEQLGNIVLPTETDRYLSIIPTNHAIDFMCGFLIPLICGTWVVHQRTLRSQFLISTFKKYQITLTALVPLLLKAIKQGIEEEVEKLSPVKRNIYDLSCQLNEMFPAPALRRALKRTVFKPVHDRFGGNLRQILAGGAFVDKSVCDFFYDLGIPVSIGYGLTEAGTAITLNDLKPYRGDTVGKPVPGTRIEIRNPDEGGVGEVWASGPGIMKGYLDDPALTREVLSDGWLRTGDLGYVDVSGHLKLVGRAKNMIVTEGGKNIYPEDIESAFEDIPACEEFCVFAANYVWPKHQLKNEKLVLVLRPKKKAATDPIVEELRNRNRVLADFKRIGAYLFWNSEFPRTATMKVKRQQLALDLRGALRGEAGLQML